MSRQLRRLFSDWMLVELDPVRERTSGGILRPNVDAEPVRTGTVIMAGPGRQYMDKFVPMPDDIIGQRVAFMIAASQTKEGTERRRYLSLANNQEIIRLGDVLLVVDGSVEVSG